MFHCFDPAWARHKLAGRSSRSLVFLAAVILLLGPGSTDFVRGQQTEGVVQVRSQAELERVFARQLSGATLVGHFTDSRETDTPTQHEERYFLQSVRKLDSGKWLFQTRIQYGTHDLTLPLTLPVVWAGDTPVIQVDELPIPGLGTFSARVMIHGGYYAGYWRAVDHGGHQFGRIERIEQKQSPSADDGG